MLDRYEEPAPSLGESQTYRAVTLLLATGGFAPLMSVEIQHFAIPDHGLPREETAGLLDKTFHYVPIRSEERQHVLVLPRAAAAIGENIAGRLQGRAVGPLARMSSICRENHKPYRLLVRHVGR